MKNAFPPLDLLETVLQKVFTLPRPHMQAAEAVLR